MKRMITAMCYFAPNGQLRWAPGDPEEINVFGCIKRLAVKTKSGWVAINTQVGKR